jgi:signal peptidase I
MPAMHMTPHAVADPGPDIPRATRRVAAFAFRTVSWGFVAAITILLVVSVAVPRIAGAQPYTIQTGSMQPTMPPGTLVVDKPVSAGDVEVGDVITYQLRPGKPEVVTHRVVSQGVDGRGRFVFWTKGDANSAVDAAPVRPVQVRGEVWYSVPYVGYVGELVSGRLRTLLLTAVLAALLGYAAVMAVAALRNRQKGTMP